MECNNGDRSTNDSWWIFRFAYDCEMKEREIRSERLLRMIDLSYATVESEWIND